MPLASMVQGVSTAAPVGSCGYVAGVAEVAVERSYGPFRHHRIHHVGGEFVAFLRTVDSLVPRLRKAATRVRLPFGNLFFAALGVFIQRDAEMLSIRSGRADLMNHGTYSAKCSELSVQK